MLAKKTSKNQITLPKAIADLYAGIQYFDVSIKNNRIVFVPVVMTPVKGHPGTFRGKRAGRGGAENTSRRPVRRARKP